jgi:hypothetical protein
LESKRALGLAASPDAIALANFDVEGTPPNACVVEVKTRVASEQIANAGKRFKKYENLVEYSNLIACEYGDEVWKDFLSLDHARQLLVQMIVTGLTRCLYIVSRPGKQGSNGRIIYITAAIAPSQVLNDFYNMLNRKLHHLLDTFFCTESVEDLVKGLPRHMSKSHIDTIASRWPFFKAMRDDVLTLDLAVTQDCLYSNQSTNHCTMHLKVD